MTRFVHQLQSEVDWDRGDLITPDYREGATYVVLLIDELGVLFVREIVMSGEGYSGPYPYTFGYKISQCAGEYAPQTSSYASN